MSTKRQFNTWCFEQHNWTHGHAFTTSSVISSQKACGCVFISTLIPCSSKAYSRRISAGCSMELFYFFLRESIKMFGVRPFVSFFAPIHFVDTIRIGWWQIERGHLLQSWIIIIILISFGPRGRIRIYCDLRKLFRFHSTIRFVLQFNRLLNKIRCSTGTQRSIKIFRVIHLQRLKQTNSSNLWVAAGTACGTATTINMEWGKLWYLMWYLE